MTNFGASFKKARESKGVSLDQIAKQTRVSSRFLAAIENEEFHVLPGGIFNKGFIRAYAEALGLDADQAVADYERLVSVQEPTETETSTAPPPSRTERHLYPIAIGILALAIAIFYLVTREPRNDDAPRTPPESTTPVIQPAVPAKPTPPTATEPVAPEPNAIPPVANTQGLRLNVEARATTWIKVRSDGTSVNAGGEILQPGMTRTFTAENSLELSIGNAAGLELKINDMPLKPLGKSGQVRFVTITPDNLKDFVG